MAPTKAEVEEHNRTHAEYRSWCPHCVAGKSVSAQHRRRDPNEEKLGVTISIDYAFRTAEEAEEDLAPILVAYDNNYESIWAIEVAAKGIEAGVGVEWLVEKLDMSGYHGTKITLKSDNEPSILAFKNAVAMRRSGETAMIESPVRESNANGQVERAIRTWRDQYRTMRHYTEHRFKKKIEKSFALNSWLISWASEVLNRFKVHSNGRTSFEMMTGHRCKHKVAAFGEKVHFQHTKNGKGEYRKDIGIFIGMMGRSNTFLIGNSDGIFGSPNIMSFPDEQAFDADMAIGIKVELYAYHSKGVSPPPNAQVVRMGSTEPNPDGNAVETSGGQYVPRRARITRKELEEYGYTANCPGCISSQLQDGIRRGAHTEECRLRVEAAMTGDKTGRVKQKMDQWTAEQVAQGETSEVKADDAKGQGEIAPNLEEDNVEDTELLDAPMEEKGSRSRYKTPERAKAVKRRSDEDVEMEPQVRRRMTEGELASPGSVDNGMEDAPEALYSPTSAADSPSQEWLRDPTRQMEEGSPFQDRNPDSDNDMSTVYNSLDEDDKKIVASLLLRVDLTEVYSPERVNKLARRFGLVVGHSLDLTNGWDFRKADDRRRAWNLLKKTQPYMVIGSPPCTLFSMLQELNVARHGKDDAWMAKFEEAKAEAIEHVEFCAQIYRYQLKNGRHFVHEHPLLAKSWKLDCMVDLVNDVRTYFVETHMCRFGMHSHIGSRSGDHGWVKKPTGFLTSSRHVAEQLDRRCLGNHDHVQLVGGRASGAQVYPDDLCAAIVKGVVKQKSEDGGDEVTTTRMDGNQTRRFINSLSSTCLGPVRDLIDSGLKGKWPGHWMDPVHEEDGGDDSFGLRPQRGIEILKGELDALSMRNGMMVAKDDVSGKDLDPGLVKAARDEEMAYFKKLGVYRTVPRSHQKSTGGKVIGTRWIDVNKGDASEPNYRSRLVGREFNVYKDDTLYASTPPLEGLRCVLSYAATIVPDVEERRCVMVNDVRRAYFYAKARRDIYILRYLTRMRTSREIALENWSFAFTARETRRKDGKTH